MKYSLRNFLLFFVYMIATNLQAQDTIKATPITDNRNAWCYERKEPLSPFAYRRMMRDHYNFTIMGSQTPVSGFKVETNKPTITLKGNITSPETAKDLVVNVELTGGVQNDLMQVFSGDQLNGYFKSSIGFNKMIRHGDNAKYIMADEMLRNIMRKKVCLYREEVAMQIDTFLVLEALESYIPPHNQDINLVQFISVVKLVARQDEFTIERYQRLFSEKAADEYYRKLILAVIQKYGADEKELNEQLRFEKFVKNFNDRYNQEIKFTTLVNDYKRLSKFKTDRKHKYRMIDSYEIETYKDVWTSKRISWINVSFAFTNSSFKLYDASAAINKLTDTNSFQPSASITYNYFWKSSVANQYFFIRWGVAFKRVSSLVDQQTFDYNKETVIEVTPTESLKSKKTGTAYLGNLTHGFGYELPIEIYWAPWSLPAIPGLYTKLQYNYGEAWINKNKLSGELGLVWNVQDDDKDSKSVLTIVPYVGWSNFLKEYKDAGKLQKRELNDLFSVGVKFGIPVSLGR